MAGDDELLGSRTLRVITLNLWGTQPPLDRRLALVVGAALVPLAQLGPLAVRFTLPQRNLQDVLAGLKAGSAAVSAWASAAAKRWPRSSSAIWSRSPTIAANASWPSTKPSGTGSPAAMSRARLAAFAPARASGRAASARAITYVAIAR